jgi:hypothetical protein
MPLDKERLAASHWKNAATKFLSNTDMYDIDVFFPAAGLSDDEARIMLTAANKLLHHSTEVLRP